MRKLAMLLGAVAALTFGTAAQAATYTFTVSGTGSTLMFGNPVALQTITGASEYVGSLYGPWSGGAPASAILDDVAGTLTMNNVVMIADGGFGMIAPNPTQQESISVISGTFSGTTLTVSSQANTELYCGTTTGTAGGVSCGQTPVLTPPVTIDFSNMSNVTFTTQAAASGTTTTINFTLAQIVPEPASLILLGGSLAGLAFLRRRAA